MSDFRRYSTIEEWRAAHPLRYRTGEEIRSGDVVDFGFDGKFANGPSLVLAGSPWTGAVVRTEGVDVLVDTYLNSIARLSPDKLTFMGRGER